LYQRTKHSKQSSKQSKHFPEAAPEIKMTESIEKTKTQEILLARSCGCDGKTLPAAKESSFAMTHTKRIFGSAREWAHNAAWLYGNMTMYVLMYLTIVYMSTSSAQKVVMILRDSCNEVHNLLGNDGYATSAADLCIEVTTFLYYSQYAQGVILAFVGAFTLTFILTSIYDVSIEIYRVVTMVLAVAFGIASFLTVWVYYPLLTKYGPVPVIHLDPMKGTIPESLIPGSQAAVIDGVLKKNCQVMVQDQNGNLITHGIRVLDFLVMPRHSLESLSGEDVDMAKCFLMNIEGDRKVPFCLDWEVTRVSRDADIVFIELPAGIWSQIGTSVANLGRARKQISVYTIWNKGLKHATPGIIGDEYRGLYFYHSASTEPGCSGCPIYSGNNVVVGMHVSYDPNKRMNIALSLSSVIDVVSHKAGRMVINKHPRAKLMEQPEQPTTAESKTYPKEVFDNAMAYVQKIFANNPKLSGRFKSYFTEVILRLRETGELTPYEAMDVIEVANDAVDNPGHIKESRTKQPPFGAPDFMLKRGASFQLSRAEFIQNIVDDMLEGAFIDLEEMANHTTGLEDPSIEVVTPLQLCFELSKRIATYRFMLQNMSGSGISVVKAFDDATRANLAAQAASLPKQNQNESLVNESPPPPEEVGRADPDAKFEEIGKRRMRARARDQRDDEQELYGDEGQGKQRRVAELTQERPFDLKSYQEALRHARAAGSSNPDDWCNDEPDNMPDPYLQDEGGVRSKPKVLKGSGLRLESTRPITTDSSTGKKSTPSIKTGTLSSGTKTSVATMKLLPLVSSPSSGELGDQSLKTSPVQPSEDLLSAGERQKLKRIAENPDTPAEERLQAYQTLSKQSNLLYNKSVKESSEKLKQQKKELNERHLQQLKEANQKKKNSHQASKGSGDGQSETGTQGKGRKGKGNTTKEQLSSTPDSPSGTTQ
jgi:hypothetical protein